jgi:1-acyl-sn-glycerol-3-phosphate acyltransferase
MSNLRAIIKLVLFITLAGVYFMVTPLFLIFYSLTPNLTRICLTRLVQLSSILCLKIFSIEVDYRLSHLSDKNYFIVCNHLSYLDIMIIASRIPTMFVTSMSIKRTPFLGQICTLAGCLFVDRKSRTNRANELEQLEQALRNGHNVTIFPEATSTNGERVKQFKMALYHSAIVSQTPVLPLCLNYYALNYYPLNSANRDNLFWYDDMSFFPHFWKMLKSKKIHARLYQGEIINPCLDSNKMELADRSRNIITQFYKPIISRT